MCSVMMLLFMRSQFWVLFKVSISELVASIKFSILSLWSLSANSHGELLPGSCNHLIQTARNTLQVKMNDYLGFG